MGTGYVKRANALVKRAFCRNPAHPAIIGGSCRRGFHPHSEQCGQDKAHV